MEITRFKHLTHRHILLFIICLFVFFLPACGGDDNNGAPDPNTIRMGYVEGSLKGELLKAVQKVGADQYSLKVKIQSYKTMEGLDQALLKREIDVNIFEPRVYWDQVEKKEGDLYSVIAETYSYPMAIYSKKVKSILDVSKGGSVALPNEPANEARALFLLEKTGLIRMKTEHNVTASVRDIISNPKGLIFKEFPAGQLVSALPNVDIAVINGDFALQDGLAPSKNALAIENDLAYPNVVVVRKGDESAPQVTALVEILKSKDIQNAAQKIFKGDITPGWKR